ncbi:MAG: hypothetical protein KC457_14355 [Myxococcales bacterium]|nr:hypothetical protein [Myxococcales bacterium]
MNTRLVILGFASMVLLAGCPADDAGDELGDVDTGDTTTDTTDTTTDTTDATTDTTDTTDTTGGGEFSPVYQLLVEQGCTAGYCHGAGQGGLFMTSEAEAYMNLVDVDATTPVCDLQKRVVPGMPDESIMWMRVRPAALDMDPPCAPKMPQGSMGLGDAEAQIINDWITGGALP